LFTHNSLRMSLHNGRRARACARAE
jgi:hypothetical protein